MIKKDLVILRSTSAEALDQLGMTKQDSAFLIVLNTSISHHIPNLTLKVTVLW